MEKLCCVDCEERNKVEIDGLLNQKVCLEHQINCIDKEIEKVNINACDICECCKEKRTKKLDELITMKNDLENIMSSVNIRLDELNKSGDVVK